VIGRLPFQPSENNYRLRVPLDNVLYLFDVRWNSRDAAWYFDIREDDETEILMGIKIVLGGKLGQTSTHPFFSTRILTVIDTSREGVDARFDDLGGRIQVVIADGTVVPL